MKLTVQKLVCSVLLAAFVLGLMAVGVAGRLKGDGGENLNVPSFPPVAEVAVLGGTTAAELPSGFHSLDKDIGFSIDFEGESDPYSLPAVASVSGGCAPKQDTKRVIMSSDKKKDGGAGKAPARTQKSESPPAPVPPAAPAALPVPGNSALAGIIRGRSYSGGLEVFQSSRNDIPADRSALMNAVKKGSNRCSFMAVRISDGACISYNVSTPYRCASAYKAFVSLFTFRQAAAGAYNLNSSLTYTAADYYPGSGIIKSSRIGTVYSLRTVADYSIRYSDNTAFTMLQRYVNKDALISYGKKIGCPSYAGFKYNWPDISALDAAMWWAEIYNFSKTSAFGRQLYDVFLSATHQSIKKALGDEYAVAHKSGSMSFYFHDTGIVHSADPYILILLTYNPCNYSNNNQSYFAPIVREIDKLINPR